MSDKIIEELWQIKDSIAREHRYDIEALVVHLQNQKAPGRSASSGSTRDEMKE